jgi:ketosteroid isomerase-like protein
MRTGWLTQARWSVLGPQPTGEPRTTAGRSGHPTSVRTAGSSSYRTLTSNGGEGCSGVRVSPLRETARSPPLVAPTTVSLEACPLDKANGVQDNRAPRAPSRTSHSKKPGGDEGRKRRHRSSESEDVVERLRRAMNAHDLEAHLACMHPDYRSAQPAHPNRGFGGREQVKKNWTAIYGAIPDFHAELLAVIAEGDTVWAEWHWTGNRADGSPFAMRGVTIFGVADDRIAWGRLYMEEVEEAGEDIDQAVRRFVEGRQ